MKKRTTNFICTTAIISLLFFLTDSCEKTKTTEDITIPSYTIPELTTSAVTSIGQLTASCGGNIRSSGGSSITVRGVCWSTSQSFTIDNCINKTTDGTGPGSFISAITGLTRNTPYYVRAYATNITGTGYGNLVSFKTLTPPFSIGQSYGGGIIFYVDGTGLHGLISATSDQSTGAPWGCEELFIGGTGTAIGTGQANTNAIVNRCSESGIAARICDDLVLNGYSDWFLPSQDELNLLYQQEVVVGGFANHGYWSSSEYASPNAWTQTFTNGTQYTNLKDSPNFVRAIRAF